MTEHATLLGIKISGDIDRRGGMVDQRPQSDLEPLIQALLDDTYIVEFGWQQYTPLFNDGEPCIFGASGLWVRTVDDDDADEDDLVIDFNLIIDFNDHPSLGGLKGPWNNRAYVGTRRAQWEVCCRLDEAIGSGAFNKVLLDLFGDHAQVTVRRDGIQVDHYHHD